MPDTTTLEKNVELERVDKQGEIGIQFKYTAPATLQLYARIEQKFSTLFYWVPAILNFWEATNTANTANLLEKNLLATIRDLIPFQQFFGKGKRSIPTSA